MHGHTSHLSYHVKSFHPTKRQLSTTEAFAYQTHKLLKPRREFDIGRSVYHFLQYIYIPTGYTVLLPSEQLFIHNHHHHKQLIPQQHIHDINSLYQTILDVYDTSLTHRNKNQYHTETSSSSKVVPAGRIR